MSSREASQRTYPQLDISEPWHTLSHHGNVPEKVAKNAEINLYFAQLFARFVQKLQSLPDGNGSLLDHSLIFYGSGMSNSNAHSTDPLPLIAVGGGAGKGNRHIRTAPKTPIGNLWLDVASRFGVPMERFGNSNGVVELL
jgi:hypothetical protein